MAAVFQLPGGEFVAEAAWGLVLDGQAKAQTSALEPALTYRLERASQLVTKQLLGEQIDRFEIAACDKTIAFLDHTMAVLAGLALDPFMAIEHDLGSKGRIATNPNHDMAPLRIDDLEIVMLHVRPGSTMAKIDNLALGIVANLPNRCRSSPDEHGKDAAEFWILGQVRFGDPMFFISGMAIDEGDIVLLAPSL